MLVIYRVKIKCQNQGKDSGSVFHEFTLSQIRVLILGIGIKILGFRLLGSKLKNLGPNISMEFII